MFQNTMKSENEAIKCLTEEEEDNGGGGMFVLPTN